MTHCMLQFVETLKPNYNNVDLSNIELVDAETMFFENNTLLMDVSLDLIHKITSNMLTKLNLLVLCSVVHSNLYVWTIVNITSNLL